MADCVMVGEQGKEKRKRKERKQLGIKDILCLTLSDANTRLCQRAVHDARDGLHSLFLQEGTMVTIDHVNRNLPITHLHANHITFTYYVHFSYAYYDHKFVTTYKDLAYIHLVEFVVGS